MVFAELVRRFDLQSAYFARQDDVRDFSRTNPFRAASTALAVQVTCDLQSADFFCFLYGMVVCLCRMFGFLNEEYRIVIVDFIPPRGGA